MWRWSQAERVLLNCRRFSCSVCALLGLLGCSDEPHVRRTLRPTRDLHLATRLAADRALLAPRVLARRPADLHWSVDVGEVVATSSGVSITAGGAFVATARVPVRSRVPYTIRVVTSGKVSEVGYQRLESMTSPAQSESCLGLPIEQFDDRDKRMTASVEDAGTASQFLGQLGRWPGGALAIDLHGQGRCEILVLEIRESQPGATDHTVPQALGLRGNLLVTTSPIVTLTKEALFAAGTSRYEWPWRGPGLFSVSTALVHRHGEERLGPLRLSVHALRGGRWTELFGELRGTAGDDGTWHPFYVPLPEDTAAIRMATDPATTGPSWQAAWGSPLITAPTSRSLPDIYLFSVDALRADHVGASGGRYPITPTIDRLAREGVVFTEGRAQRGQTWESLVAVTHAEFPERVGVAQRGIMPWRGRHTFTDVLEQAGMETYRVGQFLMPPAALGHADATFEHTEDRVTLARLLALINSKQYRPRFVMAHFFGTHYPFPGIAAPGEKQPTAREIFDWFGEGAPIDGVLKAADLYRRAIRAADAAIGEVVQAIQKRGRRAIVAVIADHGTTLGEGGIWLMHSTTQRVVLRVPVVLWGPGIIPAARRSDRLVRLIDVGPTLLDYAGLDASGFGGKTLRGLIDGKPEPGRVNIVVGVDEVVAETDEFKAIGHLLGAPQRWENYPLRLQRPVFRLFRWRQDPEELRDLSTSDPLTVGEVLSLVSRPREVVERYISPEARRLLAEAGYAAPAPQ